MIGILFVIAAVICSVLSDVTKKLYKKNTPLFFTFVCVLFADIFFVFSSGFKLHFVKEVVIYSVLFGIAFSLALLFITLSYKSGNFFSTGLVMSYSLLLPTLYGIIFLKNDTSLFFYFGLAILCVAILLIGLQPKKSKSEKKPFNFKWLILVSIAFVSNGFCSIFQTMQQNAFEGAYKSEFMIIALSMSAVVFLVLSLFLERKEIKNTYKASFALGIPSGIFNGALNLFVMYSLNRLAPSFVYPFISGGVLIVAFLVSLILFKEKYRLIQYFGFIFGLISVVLLNL